RRGGHHRHAGFSVRYVWYIDDAARGVELLIGDDILEAVDRRPEEIGLGRKDLRPFVQRTGRKDRVQLGDQFRPVDEAGTGIAESWVVQPLGAADRATQRGPVPIAFEPDDPEPPAVAGGVVVHARVAHGFALPD